MKLKIFLIIIISLIAIFMNFMNKHQIMQYSSKTEMLLKVMQSKQEINQDLLSANSKLLARDRIKKLASEELGMIFADSTPLTIARDGKSRYKLIDFLVPTAEALNR
ncbi:MAG: hypothetical protein R6U84_04670 [Candidatus Cloacimonadales bacterium]